MDSLGTRLVPKRRQLWSQTRSAHLQITFYMIAQQGVHTNSFLSFLSWPDQPQGKVPKDRDVVLREVTGRGETGDQTSRILHFPQGEVLNNVLASAKCSQTLSVYKCVYTYVYVYMEDRASPGFLQEPANGTPASRPLSPIYHILLRASRPCLSLL